MSRASRWARRVVAVVGFPSLVLVLLSSTALPAHAGQHQGGASSVGWQVRGRVANPAVWNIDQEIRLPKTGRSTYWALQWTFNGSDDPGYLGIQTNARRPDGTAGQMALFSLWNADQARNAQGRCDDFGGEGSGFSCRMNWTIRTGATYRLRVWRGTADASGQWWQGWIHSDYSNVDYHLGDIHVPAAGHTSIHAASVVNFIEYWGSAVGCTKVPMTVGVFTQPAFNRRGKAYEYYTRYRENSYQHGPCTRGYFVRLKGVGVQLVNGGTT